MHHNDPEEYLGLDVGGARIGIARGSSAARLAEPLKTVEPKDIITELQTLTAQYQTSGVVVGLPRSLEGKETAQTGFIRDWVKQAKTRIKLPFFWQDEALTTQLAEAQTSSKAGPDAKAAALILQDFLDSAKDDRVEA